MIYIYTAGVLLVNLMYFIYYKLRNFGEIKIGFPYPFYWSYYKDEGSRYGFEIYNFFKDIILYVLLFFSYLIILKIIKNLYSTGRK